MAKTRTPSPLADYRVVLTKAAAGGRKRVGDYVPGVEYSVPALDAVRLSLKGFVFVDATQAPAARAAAEVDLATADAQAAAAQQAVAQAEQADAESERELPGEPTKAAQRALRTAQECAYLIRGALEAWDARAATTITQPET
jgi:hypothetical protein